LVFVKNPDDFGESTGNPVLSPTNNLV